MPSELIKYIGKTYNAWHIALGLLESHVMLFLNDSKCSESMAELYRLLNEEYMRCGLWKKRSMTAETRAGLSLVCYGVVLRIKLDHLKCVKIESFRLKLWFRVMWVVLLLMKRLQASSQIAGLKTEQCFNIGIGSPLSSEKLSVLRWLLQETFEPENLGTEFS
ncbi:hypothetical protein POM88_000889 [Heracleum sosnowskyi]|uniref:Uncharacterized protein n=1 Tax=Heracleum sosnowskyi TaxID=360622 RepID=A0AAD8N950_9APIA|nr:hypothetical protein POM88_000889 [Heracleum sosnowskyi]